MKKNRLKPKYFTNKAVRNKVDRLLEKNARNQACVGTGSKYDLGEEETLKAWKQFEKDIKEIDPLMYDIIKKQND